MALIDISGLTKSFSAKADAAAVNDLNLSVEQNQFVTLLGPSGCGKTTTLRMLAGYIKPDAGTIHVNGRLLSSSSGVISPENRGMGMVFQNYAVWPHKTVHENVVFGLKVRKVPSARQAELVGDILELTGLAGYAQRYPSELSGGQQQRVALARSLVVEPSILMLDEPLSNLDAKLREKMRSELKQLQRRTGITFVYVTHDQAEALALSDKIAVMHGGRLQQFGSPEEVYDRPANKIVADFMGLINFLRCIVLEVSAKRTTLGFGDSKLTVQGTLPGAVVGKNTDLSIRPENIELSDTSDTGLKGVIREATFLGNMYEYIVALPDGQTVRVQTHPWQRLAADSAVSVTIDANRCSAFDVS